MFKIAAIILFISSFAFAQEERSFRQIQNDFYSSVKAGSESDYDKLNPYSSDNSSSATLQKQVFGWNPYWVGTAYNSYNYNLLSTVAYFSYEVDTASGSYKTVHFWKTTNLIPLAHSHNVKVVLTVTNFGSASNTKILSNAVKRQRLIDSLVSLVQLRNADGVNIDFELVPASQRQNLVTFMTDLSSRFHSAIPGSKVSLTLPAVDWNNSFDIPALNAVCDQMVIMGYDYHWSSAPNAGPVAPLQGGGFWGNYHITSSVDYYRNSGASAAKLLLAVPYYGYQWPTTSSSLNSATTGTGTAYTYANIKPRAATYGRLWDSYSLTPWYRYNSSGWKQGWYEDSISLTYKYNLVNSRNIGGIGIWALSYDGSNDELWNLIAAKFGGSVSVSSQSSEIHYKLHQNFPNPFNPLTTIKIEMLSRKNVSLIVYDSRGSVIKVLHKGDLNSGTFSFNFNGEELSSGIYFYSLITPDFISTKKMLLLK